MTQKNGLFRKTTAYVLISLMLVCSLTSCRPSSPKTYESYSPEKETTQKSEEQVSFDQFTLDLFREEITDDMLDLHYTLQNPASYGISDYTPTLGTISQEDTRESSEQTKELQKKLKNFDYEELTSKQKLTYDILDNTLKLNITADTFPYYNEMLQPSIGLQTQYPTLLAEYTFHTEKDITDYLALLKDTERYFKEIIAYEEEKADAGLFMSDYCVDLVIQNCKSFISQTNDNFLIITFEERLNEMNGLDDSRKKEYIEKNTELVTTSVINAYQMLIDALENLKGRGTNEGGICNYKKGKDYYEYLLKRSVGTDRSVSDLEQMTIDQINKDFQICQTLLQEHPALNSALTDFSFTLTDPEKIIEDLQTKMQKDFPALNTTINLQIKHVSKSMEDSLSPAFYLTPPIDNLTDNIIYINDGFSDASELYTTLAHEGYPGHLYQTVYSSSCSSDPIRELCSVAGYSEGWATYVENLAYYYDTNLDKNLTSVLQHNNSAVLGIYALLDFYINYEGCTLKQIHDWLQDSYTTLSEDSTKELYYTLVSQPCNYLKYYIGYLEILELKTEAQTALGDDFSLKEFHTFLLEIGDAPFYIIREYMHAWIKSYGK